MASIFGRQVVVAITNKSGGSVVAGDVVVVDTGNDGAFTTSTAGAVTGGVGVAQETIANNASGRVLIGGYAALVNVNASVTRGNFGKTHTVAKQATDAGSARTLGTFCQFLTGGTTPTAMVFQPDLTAGTLTDHTHAATGSGANGGGSTLSPVTLNVPQSSPGTTEGRIGWGTTLHDLLGYDTVQARPLSPAGFAPLVAYPGVENMTAFTSSRVLAAVSGGNAGAALAPLFAPAPFFPYDFTIWSNDTATARTAEIRLYVDLLGNASSLAYVANTAATFSFTPSAASKQQSTTITAAGLLPAGWYYAVIRNTSATQTFSIGTNAGAVASTILPYASLFITTASIAALGATIDPTTLTSGSTAQMAILVRTLVAGGATPLFA